MLTLIQKGYIISIMKSILCLVSRMHKQQLPLVAGWNSTRPSFAYANEIDAEGFGKKK